MPPTGDPPFDPYVPGKTPRPPEGAFDQIRDTARLGLSVSDLAASAAFQSGLRYLDEGYFWEAHEVLEPVWMALEDASCERKFVQGLIQLANGLLKMRMNRPKAALRLSHIARALVPNGPSQTLMGVSLADIHHRIDSLENSAIKHYNA